LVTVRYKKGTLSFTKNLVKEIPLFQLEASFLVLVDVEIEFFMTQKAKNAPDDDEFDESSVA
jgi:hypothetical protein